MLLMRLVAGAALAVTAACAVAAFGHGPAEAQTREPGCGIANVTMDGTTYRIVFARNGAVQRYELVRSSANTETDHNTLEALQARFGPEAINAPPMRIVQYRDAGGGMRVPLKAVDSCGRLVSFR